MIIDRDRARELVGDTLLAHDRDTPGGCSCGWNKLGQRFSRHVADAILHILGERFSEEKPSREWQVRWGDDLEFSQEVDNLAHAVAFVRQMRNAGIPADVRSRIVSPWVAVPHA